MANAKKNSNDQVGTLEIPENFREVGYTGLTLHEGDSVRGRFEQIHETSDQNGRPCHVIVIDDGSSKVGIRQNPILAQKISGAKVGQEIIVQMLGKVPTNSGREMNDYRVLVAG